ncbi:MAG TPA: glycosyltransferase family A protein [Parafilimonas sp.]|nr:glycosyltransferase family A protein [Parafilimonas sp.]
MLFSVIIPTCNRNELLSKCLELLKPGIQTIDGSNYEVIVTDDSKESNAEEFIQSNYDWVQWVKGPGKGPAANRNNGSKYAKGEWLIFIDDDCLPDKELLNEYKTGIKNNSNCLAFEGAILPDDFELLKKDMAECPVNTNGGCFWSANICTNANLLKQIGGFDESYLIAAQEDQQLKIDIEKHTQEKIVFMKDAKVVHPVRFISFSSKLLRIPIVSRNFCLYAYRNREILGYTSMLAFFKSEIFVHLKQLMFFLKKGSIKSFLVESAWISYGVPLNLFNYFFFKRRR